MQYLASAIVAFAALPLILLMPEQVDQLVNVVFKWITNKFDVAFLGIGFGALVFVLWLAFSRYGSIKLSKQAETKPVYSQFAWASMLVLAGVATLIMWSGVEWGYHYAWTPFGIEAKTKEMYVVGQAYGMFHWGPTAWALYTVPAVAISIAYYKQNGKRYSVEESCRPLLGDSVDGALGSVINYLFIFGIIFGAATSLGLGTPMIAGALAVLFGLENTTILTIPIIIVCGFIFTFSSGLGLDKGIKRLSIFCATSLIAIVLYVLLVGPTNFVMKLGFDSVGYLLDNYIKMSFWTDSVNQSGFPQAWTVFYWAWWVSYAPFMGMFIARISRGRTIKQVILGAICYGTLGSTFFYMVVGGYSIALDHQGLLAVADIVNAKGGAAATVEIFKTLPMSFVVMVLLAIAGLVLLATTFDSAAYTIACASTYNLAEGEDPQRSNRIFWCFLVAALPIIFISIDANLKTIQTAAVITGLPLMFLMLVMIVSIYKYVVQCDLK